MPEAFRSIERLSLEYLLYADVLEEEGRLEKAKEARTIAAALPAERANGYFQ